MGVRQPVPVLPLDPWSRRRQLVGQLVTGMGGPVAVAHSASMSGPMSSRMAGIGRPISPLTPLHCIDSSLDNRRSPAEENSAALAQNIFDINVFGVIRMTNAALPHMRAQGSGRIVNLSSILGIIPQPYMAVYAASKHAVEGYSESLDHEVREYGVRVLLVEPAFANTAFDANTVQPDQPLHAYAQQRRVFEEYVAASIKAGDDPALVAKAIVAAATDTKPKPRYPVGRSARVSTMRRLVPAGIFDKQIRKINRLPA
ncbi:SDR family NAD(P)-dependent oxidoreductase [Nocardia sp. NPDC055002]